MGEVARTGARQGHERRLLVVDEGGGRVRGPPCVVDGGHVDVKEHPRLRAKMPFISARSIGVGA